MEMTEEQKAILEAVERYNRIKILALAGTGKTTTLKMIAEKYKDKRILFLAFNASVRAECKTKFPRNVDVHTVHSYAYAYYRNMYNVTQVNNVSISVNLLEHHLHVFNEAKSSFIKNIVRAIRNKSYLDYDAKRDLYQFIHIIRTMYEEYLYSNENSIANFVSTHRALEDAIDIASNSFGSVQPEDISELIEFIFNAQVINRIPTSHDVYVKWFANSLPDIYRDAYDIVLLDEAQDSNMVTEQIIERLPIRRRTMVGDSHQKIYGFRKAIAVIDLWQADVTLTLTTTFRCPEHVCEYANRILEWKNSNIFLKSFKDKQKEPIETVAYISRTNSALIDIMLNLNKANQDYKTIRPIEELFSIPRAVDAYFQGHKEPARKLLPYVFKEDFIDIEHLEKRANEENNSELILAIRILKKLKSMGMDIESAFKVCKEKLNINSKRILATAHSSKGLEWDSVIIHNDFPYLPSALAKAYFQAKIDIHTDIFDVYYELLKKVYQEKDSSYTKVLNVVSQAIEEVNLYYVAITRARSTLKDTSENANIITKDDLFQEIQREFTMLQKEVYVSDDDDIPF